MHVPESADGRMDVQALAQQLDKPPKLPHEVQGACIRCDRSKHIRCDDSTLKLKCTTCAISEECAVHQVRQARAQQVRGRRQHTAGTPAIRPPPYGAANAKGVPSNRGPRLCPLLQTCF
jgi:hypothetical protein